MAKVRGKLPTDFYFGIDWNNLLSKTVIPVIAGEMTNDHHFCFTDQGKIQFFPIFDGEYPMSFTTTLNAMVDYEMETNPGIADAIIHTLEVALRRAKKAKRKL
jgi:hypothetical protein